MFNKSNYQKAIIVDLDGTVANNSHREHYAKSSQWDEFNALTLGDTPMEATIAAVNGFAMMGYKVVVFTGRQESAAKDTIEWLEKHKMTWHEMEMRRIGDYSPAPELKRRWFRAYSADCRFECAFEDDPNVCVMWRELGLHVFRIDRDE